MSGGVWSGRWSWLDGLIQAAVRLWPALADLGGPVEERQRLLARLYLALAAPALLLLCVATQPLHAVDEPAHFLRVVQVARGGVLPVLGPDRHSTGSLQDAGTRRLAAFYGTSFRNYQHGDRKTSPAELAQLGAIRAEGDRAYVSHSNTTIYVPLAYAAPLVGVAGAMLVTDRPLLWLYAGRLLAALCGLGVAFAAIRGARRGGWLLFALALLPITLFLMASLSADSLLLPMAMLLASLVGRVADGERLGAGACLVAVGAAAVVGLGKIAYLPLVTILPVAAIVRQRAIDRRIAWLLAACAGLLLLSLAWDVAIKGLVFTVNQGPAHDRIDVDRQLALVLHQPAIFLSAVLHSLTPHLLWEYLASFAGGILGWLDVNLPAPVVLANALVLLAAAGLDRAQAPTAPALRGYVLLMCAACGLAVFLFLYLQWNPVAAPYVQGVQGRYFLPLAPFVAMVVPTRRLSGRGQAALGLALLAWGWCATAATLLFVVKRYWGVI